MGMLGQPEDVADVVAFLVGPGSRYMTGQAINVTGGMIMY
jgi:NAD(P)-dependent dehydrogenase (short-subunit alcohol dehydrogenase family)